MLRAIFLTTHLSSAYMLFFRSDSPFRKFLLMVRHPKYSREIASTWAMHVVSIDHLASPEDVDGSLFCDR